MLTNNFERPFKPNFGANLRGLLFELADDITKYEIRSQIMEAVEAYEPRVRVNQIDLQQSRTGNDMHVSLIYGTEVEGLTAAEVRTALNVEDGADVTDTANVTSAGALMDSELTNLAAVKAINQGLTQTSNVNFNNLTLGGDLVVNGTTTTLNTTNLNVEDQFILVNSGSTAKDAGIVFGGTSGTAQQGKAIIWDYSYNSNDGRLAVSSTDVAHNSTSNFAAGTTGYYVAGVFEGNSSDAATAKADHAGNIRIESSEIYIYV